MGIIINGTTIPENVANALNANGINITQVIANGVEVWKQSLVSYWSGSSTVLISGRINGLSTSGELYSYVFDNNYGTWLTATSNGMASGWTGYSLSVGITTTPTTLRHRYSSDDAPSYITYSKTTGFSGKSYGWVLSPYYAGFETSGGLMRYRYKAGMDYIGAYVSLA